MEQAGEFGNHVDQRDADGGEDDEGDDGRVDGDAAGEGGEFVVALEGV